MKKGHGVHLKVEHKHGVGHDFYNRLQAADTTKVVVGILGEKKARKNQKAKIDNVALGAIHEFGTSTIPARPWLKPPMMAHRKDFVAALADAYRKAKSQEELERLLGRIGFVAVAKIQQHIRAGAGIPPPLEAETIRRKKSSRPLVDTGQFLRSISFVVRRKGPEGGHGGGHK